jgi:hypothetical protein
MKKHFSIILFTLVSVYSFSQNSLKEIFKNQAVLNSGHQFKIQDVSNFTDFDISNLDEYWNKFFVNASTLKLVGKISLGNGKFAYVTFTEFSYGQTGNGKKISAWILNNDNTYNQEFVLAEESNWQGVTPAKIYVESKLNTNTITFIEKGFDSNNNLIYNNTHNLGINSVGGIVKL